MNNFDFTKYDDEKVKKDNENPQQPKNEAESFRTAYRERFQQKLERKQEILAERRAKRGPK